MLSSREELPPTRLTKSSEVRTYRPEYMKRSNYLTPRKQLNRSKLKPKKNKNNRDNRKRSLSLLMMSSNLFKKMRIREPLPTTEFKSLMPTTSRNEL